MGFAGVLADVPPERRQVFRGPVDRLVVGDGSQRIVVAVHERGEGDDIQQSAGFLVGEVFANDGVVFTVNVTVTGECATCYKVWLGQEPIMGALKNGTLKAEGQAAITRRVIAALQLSPIAEVVRTAQG